MSEVKAKVDNLRVRGRNYHDCISQLIEVVSKQQGWALKRVVPTGISLDVYLERSTAQGLEDEKIEVAEAEEVGEESNTLQQESEEKAPMTPVTPRQSKVRAKAVKAEVLDSEK